MLNPPQEKDWAYGPGRPTQENLSSSQTPQPTLQLRPPIEGHPTDQSYFGSRYVSSGSSSRSSSCSQSDVSVGSHHYKPSDWAGVLLNEHPQILLGMLRRWWMLICADGAIWHILEPIFEASVSDVKNQLIPAFKQEDFSKEITNISGPSAPLWYGSNWSI
jgi:hypothetical protein